MENKLQTSETLTEELIESIAEAVSKGISISAVCGLTGISRTIYYKWTKQGIEDRENGRDTIFSKLVDRVDNANATLEQKILQRIIESDETLDLRWYLSRKFRQDYGDKLELEHNGNIEFEIVWPDYTEE